MSLRPPRQSDSGASDGSITEEQNRWGIKHRWSDYAVLGSKKEILIRPLDAREWFEDWTGISLEPLTWVLGSTYTLRFPLGFPHLLALDEPLPNADPVSDPDAESAATARKADAVRRMDAMVYEYLEAERPEQMRERKGIRPAVKGAAKLAARASQLLRQLCADPGPNAYGLSSGLVADPEGGSELDVAPQGGQDLEPLADALDRMSALCRAEAGEAGRLDEPSTVVSAAHPSTEPAAASATPASSSKQPSTVPRGDDVTSSANVAQSVHASSTRSVPIDLRLHVLHKVLRWRLRRWSTLVSFIPDLERAAKRLKAAASHREPRGDKAHGFRALASGIAAILTEVTPGDVHDKVALLCAGLDFATAEERKRSPEDPGATSSCNADGTMIDLVMVRARVVKAIDRTRQRQRRTPSGEARAPRAGRPKPGSATSSPPIRRPRGTKRAQRPSRRRPAAILPRNR